MLCEQCGNEYKWGKKVQRGDKVIIACPYCNYFNNKRQNNKKKKEVN